MLSKLKQTIERQIIFFAAAAGLSFLLSWYFDYKPHMLISTKNLVLGAAAGGGTFLLLAFAGTVLFLLKPGLISPLLTEAEKSTAKTSVFVLAGSILTGAVAEELLLRTMIFGLLSRFSPALAFLVNFVLAFLLYFQNRRTTANSLAIAAAASALAGCYFAWKSFFLISCARLTFDLLCVCTLRFRPSRIKYPRLSKLR